MASDRTVNKWLIASLQSFLSFYNCGERRRMCSGSKQIKTIQSNRHMYVLMIELLEIIQMFLLAGNFLCMERFHQNIPCLVCTEYFVNKAGIMEF